MYTEKTKYPRVYAVVRVFEYSRIVQDKFIRCMYYVGLVFGEYNQSTSECEYARALVSAGRQTQTQWSQSVRIRF